MVTLATVCEGHGQGTAEASRSGQGSVIRHTIGGSRAAASCPLLTPRERARSGAHGEPFASAPHSCLTLIPLPARRPRSITVLDTPTRVVRAAPLRVWVRVEVAVARRMAAARQRVGAEKADLARNGAVGAAAAAAQIPMDLQTPPQTAVPTVTPAQPMVTETEAHPPDARRPLRTPKAVLPVGLGLKGEEMVHGAVVQAAADEDAVAEVVADADVVAAATEPTPTTTIARLPLPTRTSRSAAWLATWSRS